jgi:hypothetical protein
MWRRSAVLVVFGLGLAGAAMVGACLPSKPLPGPYAPGVLPTAEPFECRFPPEKPCMRYRIPLIGNPSTDVLLRNKYIAAFGSACYMSDDATPTFNCFYRKWEDACADAVKIAEVYGAAPYDKGYTCQPVPGSKDYTLQVGPDVANKITINYQNAPRQTAKIEINGVPTEVNGPYRNLPEPVKVEPGGNFNCVKSQREMILQANRNANDGKLKSDLKGFNWPCEENGVATTCIEEEVLKEGPASDPNAAQVHHVVRRKDKRLCPWGTNSNKNAAVISRRLNIFLTNNQPTAEEVTTINLLPPTPP